METITNIDANDIIPGNNDRTVFDPIEIENLAASIKEHGLIQPITVRDISDNIDKNIYMIVAGERRYRACKLLGWTEIPAIVRDLTDEEASAIMLTENVTRQDLDPIDEGIAYKSRMNVFGWSVNDISEKTGISTTRIRFRLKLLNLNKEIIHLVRTGNLSLGYAQILADAELDYNFQMLSFSCLRDNPSPTPSWFRRIVSEYKNKQAQTTMFDVPLFGGSLEEAVGLSNSFVCPPTPSTHKPPKIGKTTKEVVRNQAGFWETAAEEWDKLGKPFKRQECQAAAQALLFAL